MFYTYYKQMGGKIYLRYKDSEYRTISKVLKNYKPTLYQVCPPEEAVKKSIFGDPLKPVVFSSMSAAKKQAETYKNIDALRFFGNANFVNQFIIEVCKGEVVDYKADKIRYCIFDIEVDPNENEDFPEPSDYDRPVTSISLYDSQLDCYHLYGLKTSPRASWVRELCCEDVPKDIEVHYEGFDTEEELLRKIIEYFKDRDFDFTSGWNSEEFDLPYLTLRSMYMLGEDYVIKNLSPFGKINIRTKLNKFKNEYIQVEVIGLPHIDYLNLYKKHMLKPRENYKLDYIAEHDTGRKKVEFEGSLRELYRNDYQLYGDYNLIDTFLIREIERVNGFFQLTYALMYYTLTNFNDTLGTVGIWERLMAKYLYSKDMVPPYYKSDHQKEDFEGGFVYEVKRGLKRGVVSYDLKSLYPHCEMQYNIGVETHIPFESLPDELKTLKLNHTFQDLIDGVVDTSVLKKYDYAMTGSFEFYRKDLESSTAAIKRDIYKDRSQFKKTMLNHESESLKIKQEIERRGLSVDD